MLGRAQGLSRLARLARLQHRMWQCRFLAWRERSSRGQQNMPKRKGVFTTGDVARICQVAPRTVSKWFDTGKLKGYRVPGSKDRRIPRTELVRFMQSHAIPLNGLDIGQTRVLIVDPERRLGTTLEAAINRQEHYSARSVASAFAAGLEAAEFDPHLILVIPTGAELGHARFSRPVGTSSTGAGGFRLIAVASDHETAAKLRRLGYDDCLVRPFDIEDALRLIDALVEAGDAD